MTSSKILNRTSRKISVIMSVFNGEKFVKRAIKSVIEQTYRNFEFIIINDASTDHTQNILEKFRQIDKRIKLITNKKNLGLTKSLNIGLKNSNSSLIARIDSDDWWEPDKLEQQLNFLNKNPDYGIVGTWAVSHNSLNGKVNYKTRPVDSIKVKNHLLKGTPFAHSSIVFKKDLVNYYDVSYKTSQDYELYSRILEKTKGYNLPKFLTHRPRHHLSSVSVKNWRLQKRNKLRVKMKLFRKYKAPLWYYLKLLPDLLALALLPPRTKLWISKIKKFLNNRRIFST